MNRRDQYQKLIHHNVPSPLSSIAHHHDVDCIERFFADTYPLHLAIHKVTSAANVARYTELHCHDVPEINIVVGDERDELTYEIQLEDETFCVAANSTVWIPAGMMHAANVLSGSGYFIAIRLNGFERYGQEISTPISTALVKEVNGR